MIYANNTNLFVSAMWRSGSTHISHAIAEMCSYRMASTAGVHGNGVEHQEINYITASILFRYGYQVFHQHTWGTRNNVDIMKAFNIRPIICTRPIEDIIVSVNEHVTDVETYAIPGLPFPPYWHSLSTDEQYIWLAHTVSPWCLHFQSTWEHADIDKMFVDYNTFYADQVAGFQQIYEFLGLPVPPKERLEEFSKRNYNLKVGKPGRGANLPKRALEVIESNKACWR